MPPRMFFFKKQDEGFIGGTVGHLMEQKEELENQNPGRKGFSNRGVDRTSIYGMNDNVACL